MGCCAARTIFPTAVLPRRSWSARCGKGFGVDIGLPIDADPFVALFSESTGRVLVSIMPDLTEELESLCAEAEIPVTRLGVVGPKEGAELHIAGQFTLPLDRIREAWSSTLPGGDGSRTGGRPRSPEIVI